MDIGMVVSLSERRKAKNKKLVQAGKTDITRLAELEAEMSKVMDLVWDLQAQLEAQKGYTSRILEYARKAQKDRERGRVPRSQKDPA